MDALSDILKTIRLHTSTYFCSHFNTHWGMDIDKRESGLFHVLMEGSCWLKAANQNEPVRINEGDIVAFPTGGAHWIGDNLESERLPGNEAVNRIVSGDNPFYKAADHPHSSIRNTLMCGAFEYDSSIRHPLIKGLPCFIHIKANDNIDIGWLKTLIQVLSSETRQPSPGSTIVSDRLTEILFIQLLRLYMINNKHENGYLHALADTRIGKVLNLIHNEQENLWTVNTLADQAALSRSAFTERFTRMVGESPKSYLMNWRMQRARRLLNESKLSMHAIAEKAGYASEAAFSKAFKQNFGISPGAYRRS